MLELMAGVPTKKPPLLCVVVVVLVVVYWIIWPGAGAQVVLTQLLAMVGPVLTQPCMSVGPLVTMPQVVAVY